MDRSVQDRSWPTLSKDRQDGLTSDERESGGTDGAPRIHAALRQGPEPICCSRKRIARLMREANLQGVHRRRLKGTTRRDPSHEASPDRVKRQFTANGPNRLWVADITQHRTAEGWLYLAVVLDVFSRRVVGWSMDARVTAELVLQALNMAIARRQPEPGLIHHSDHGSQYTSLAFGQRLENAGLLGSMGTVGDALDHAMAESFFATLETERFNRQQWSARQPLRSAIFEDIEAFYNRRRLHSALDYESPVSYERRWYDKPHPMLEKAVGNLMLRCPQNRGNIRQRWVESFIVQL